MIPLTRAIPERIRSGYDDALYTSTFTSPPSCVADCGNVCQTLKDILVFFPEACQASGDFILRSTKCVLYLFIKVDTAQRQIRP